MATQPLQPFCNPHNIVVYRVSKLPMNLFTRRQDCLWEGQTIVLTNKEGNYWSSSQHELKRCLIQLIIITLDDDVMGKLMNMTNLVKTFSLHYFSKHIWKDFRLLFINICLRSTNCYKLFTLILPLSGWFNFNLSSIRVSRSIKSIEPELITNQITVQGLLNM